MANEVTEERELAAAALAEDRRAFAALVERYRDAVYAVAYHYLGNCDDAQDATQEAFVRAYLRLGQLRDPERFAPWLRRIAANVSTDFLRRRGEGMLPIEAVPEPAAPSGAGDPERVAARLVVRDALARLPEPARLAVTLFYMNGYSQAEIARFLDVPVSTVSSRLQHARERLRGEMIGMVEDVLQEGKPDPEFTRQVVEEAMRRAQEAQRSHEADEVLRHLDEALAAIEKLEPGEEQLRLKMDALWRKGTAAHFPLGREVARALYEEALAIAEELGERERQPGMLETIGNTYQDHHKAVEYYRRALQGYQELGNAYGQGTCLMWLANQHLGARKASDARPCCEQALPLFEAAGSREWVAVCRAALDLLDEVGEGRFASLLTWDAVCYDLRVVEGRVVFWGQPGFGAHLPWNQIPPDLAIASLFYQVAHVERTILDASVPVGGSRSGDTFSYSCRPLRATVTVRSNAERVTVPAGSFEGCLLMEQVTVESDQPDEAPERPKELNRMHRCGTRRAWWAPGVGLAQLQV